MSLFKDHMTDAYKYAMEGLKVATGYPAPSAMQKIEMEIKRRDMAGLVRPGNRSGGDYYDGWVVADLLASLPPGDRAQALHAIRAQQNALVGGISLAGIGGGGVSAGFVGVTSGPSSEFSYAAALAMRMRWPGIHLTPFESVSMHVAYGKKVFIHIVTKDLKTVTIEADDNALFPSDELVTQLRLLAG